MAITIVGLGPGDGRYITREAWKIISAAERLVLRTTRHPAVSDLPETAQIVSFDDVYESADTFEEVYATIAAKVMEMGRAAAAENRTVIYAVPGHPLVGETTVTKIMTQAKSEGLEVTIVSGLSFLEPTLTALGQDAFDGLQLVDAVEIGGYTHPPLNSDVPVLLVQVYDPFVAGDIKLALMNQYPDDHEVVMVHEAGTEMQSVERIPLYEIDRSKHIGHLTSLLVPPLRPPNSLSALAETVAYLRGPEGCPWDQEQTSQSLRAGFLEEASEVLQAIDDGDMSALGEELGDLFYHMVMQAQIAMEAGEFTLGDVIGGIIDKLKRRHPHVWGDVKVTDSQEVIRNWQKIKVQENHGLEKGQSALNSVPNTLPALSRAQKMQERASSVGFDWPSIDGVQAKIREELVEVSTAKSGAARQMELGDLLFALVNWMRWLDFDAEGALRDANRRFERRFRLVEQIALERGLELPEMSIKGFDGLWEEAKVYLASESMTGVDQSLSEEDA